MKRKSYLSGVLVRAPYGEEYNKSLDRGETTDYHKEGL
jgi:hypothetical protein